MKQVRWKYPLAKHVIDKYDIDSLVGWLKKTNRLTMSTVTREFEKQWAKFVGAKYAIYCNSGSSANLLMASALLETYELRNKKVIVPACGWSTSIAPFIQLGYEPIMCGSDKETFALDLEELERLLKKHRPSVVVLVHVLGVPAKMNEYLKLKRKHKFFLIEDACASVGAKYNNRFVGTFGDMGSNSLYFGHQLSTIEGGIVNTDSRELYETVMMLRSHGWAKDLDKKRRTTLSLKYGVSDFHDPFIFFMPGYNLRPTDLGAVIGLSQLTKAQKIFAIRHKNHLLYSLKLKNLTWQKWDSKSYVCSISFAAIAQSKEHRKRIVKELDRNKIETRIFSAGNLGLHPFWFESFGKFHHKVSDELYNCGFFLPNNESLRDRDVKFIANVVNGV